MSDPVSSPAPLASLSQAPGGLGLLIVEGFWRLDRRLPEVDQIVGEITAAAQLRHLRFDSAALVAWDSGLVSFLTHVLDACAARSIEVDPAGLPEGVRGLLLLASAVPERAGARGGDERSSFVAMLGNEAIDLARSTGEILYFVGEIVIACGRMLRGAARFRRSELWSIVQAVGADALPIVSLVTFLVGIILAYIGGDQLSQFGALVYVADLVGLAVVVQMGALVTAIVLAGRTGAAFAAHLGSMQVNEEIDALRTLGISPIEFLVLPRMLALVCMTPLLTIYADVVGILGGAVVATAVYNLTFTEYFNRIEIAVNLGHAVQGVVNGTIYGAIVAISGCLRGMQCGRSAADVGLATTSAVVTSIVFIVIAAAISTIVFDTLGW